MVKIGLEFKANLENITNLVPEGEDFRWYLRLKCGGCGEETSDFLYLTLTESHPLKGGRGSASLVVKCKFCSRDNSIDILRETIKPYMVEDSNKFKKVAVFECRGLEPVEYSPRVGYVAEGIEGGTKFTEVDLNEGEWYDYDEKKSLSVEITDIESRFVKVK